MLSAGALDPTFNPTGSPPGIATNAAQVNQYAVLVQPSGKIVLAGYSFDSKGNQIMSASCFNANGTLDTTFGSGGTAMPSFKGGNAATVAFDAALYPTGGGGDQKILLVGGGHSGTKNAFALERLNANGSPDTSFGSGGLVVTTFTQGTTSASGVVIESNGQIVVAGDSGGGFELARYNANGSLDTTFGSGGKVYTPLPNGTAAMHCLAQAANGDLIVVGDTGASPQWVLAAYTSTGSLDSSFGSGGLVYNSAFVGEPTAVAVYPATDPSGNAHKIVLTGFDYSTTNTSTSNFDLARYNPNGTLDTTFGNGGDVTTAIMSDAEALNLAIQSDGKLVVAGTSWDGSTHYSALVRYNADGSLDGTFGSGGIVTTAIRGNSKFYGLGLQPNGDIVPCGYSNGSPHYVGTVARFLPSSPEIGSFTATQSAAGAPVTLTASNIPDGNPNSTIGQVAFYYYDSNGNQIAVGTVTSSDGFGNWTLSASLPPGSYTLFAQATDSLGVLGDPIAYTLTVQ